jgi:hypothetical protein
LSDTAVVNEDSNYVQNNNSRQFKYTVTIQGYWPNAFNSKSTRIPFDPGIYTVVAGDEWGNLVILHFTVAR